jgi:hypothetical protein
LAVVFADRVDPKRVKILSPVREFVLPARERRDHPEGELGRAAGSRFWAANQPLRDGARGGGFTSGSGGAVW